MSNTALQREPTAEIATGTLAASIAKTGYLNAPDFSDFVLSLLHQAAERGDAESQAKLGAMYAAGEGVPVDYFKAAQYLKKAVDKKQPLALYNTGVMHANGAKCGVEDSPQKAFSLYEKSAEMGLPDALNNLGHCYQNAYGCVRNLRLAFDNYEAAARRGHGLAMSNCGYMKELGFGTSPDIAEALMYYRNAANHGYPEAKFSLGRLLACTETRHKDPVEGRRVLQKRRKKVWRTPGICSVVLSIGD